MFMIGSSHILNIRNKYNNIKNLNDLDYKIFSQNGEDGIIDYLLRSLNIYKPNFIEIGTGDYTESNTRFLFESSSPRGLIIDCIKDFQDIVKENLKLWKGDLTIEESFVDSDNILKILKKNNFDKNIDLFSLDIDGIDYWIIEKLPNNFSKIAVLEYNPIFGFELEVSVPNSKKFNRSEYHYSNLCYGMSLKALIKLMSLKGFYFVGSNLLRNNAFFISNQFSKEKFFPSLKVSPLFEHVECNIRESRDKNYNLNYLKGKKKIEEIKECKIVDLSDQQNKIVKIKDLLEVNYK